MKTQVFYNGTKVKIMGESLSPLWRDKEGTIIKWVHDNFYIVKETNTGAELVLDASRGEMERV